MFNAICMYLEYLLNCHRFIRKKVVSGQSYKASTIVIYDSRVVNYERKLFIRLATDLLVIDNTLKRTYFEYF